LALVGVRVALPALIALVGLVVLIIGKADAANGIGMALIGVALLVLVANLLMRLGLASERDRRREQEARRRFERTGRWDQ
jgi:Flp pilus assembly protein TadB